MRHPVSYLTTCCSQRADNPMRTKTELGRWAGALTKHSLAEGQLMPLTPMWICGVARAAAIADNDHVTPALVVVAARRTPLRRLDTAGTTQTLASGQLKGPAAVVDTGNRRTDHLNPPSAVVSMLPPLHVMAAHEVEEEHDKDPGSIPLGNRATRATDRVLGST